MVKVQIAVPTLDRLSQEFSIEVKQPEFPDGSILEKDITAIVGGYPGNPNDEILGFVFPNEDERTDYSTSAQYAEVYPELKEAIIGAMTSELMK